MGIEAQQLRNAVHQRLFGREADPIRIGRYTVLKRLGSGGMGIVYAAYDTELDRKVAVKLLHAGDRDTQTWRSRLRREAQALAKLSHPNVVQVYDVGEYGDQVFVPMEFVEGPNLREWAAATPHRAREIVAVYLQAGRGLAAAHRAGIVHRDFKPDNAIVGRGAGDGDTEQVRVLDFGLARGKGEPDPTPGPSDPSLSGSHVLLLPLTRSGAIMGTPAYMSPEQHLGVASDERTDQFSFCVALYEALYGERPFAGSNLTALRQHVLDGDTRAAPRDATVPNWIRRVLLRGLAREPADRYPSMDDLIEDLSRDPAVLLRRILLVVGVVVLVAGAAFAWQRREERYATEEARLEVEAARERQRAEQLLVDRADGLTLREVQFYLDTDPTRAAANLLNLSDSSPAWNGEARMIAADAAHRGIAQSVSQLAEGEVPHVLSPDGRRLVTRSPESGGLHLVDLASGARRDLVAGAQGVPVVSVNPAGTAMVTLMAPEGVAWWTLPGGDASRLGDAPAGHHAIVWAPDGRRFATFGRSTDVHVWSPDGVETVLGPHAEEVDVAAIDGDAVGTVDVTGTLRWFTLSTGEVRSRPGLAPIAFGPGPALASATNLAGLQVVIPGDAEGELVVAAEWPGGDTPVRAVAFAPGGEDVAIGLADGEVRLWSPRDGWDRVVGRHDDDIVALEFSEDGNALVSQSRDRTLAIAHLAGGRRQVLRGHHGVGFWALDRDGQEVVSVGWEGEIRRWSLHVTQHMPARLRGTATMALAVSDRVVAGGRDGSVIAWSPNAEPEVLARLGAAVTTIADGADGTLAVATERGDVFVFDASGRRHRLVEGAGDAVAVAFAADGIGIAVGMPGEGISTWSRPVGEATTRVDTGDLRIQRMAACDDGRVVIAGWTHDGRTWLTSIDAARTVTRRPLGADGILGVAFGPRCGRIAWSTHTRKIMLLENDRPVRELGQHPALVDAMLFDPSGRTLATVGRDGRMLLWDIASGRHRSVEVSSRPLRGIAYDAGRSMFVTAGDDERIHFVSDALPHDAEALRAWIRDATSMRVEAKPIE